MQMLAAGAAALVLVLSPAALLLPPPARAEEVTIKFKASSNPEVAAAQKTLVEAWGARDCSLSLPPSSPLAHAPRLAAPGRGGRRALNGPPPARPATAPWCPL